jgi:hypothetical protein
VFCDVWAFSQVELLPGTGFTLRATLIDFHFLIFFFVSKKNSLIFALHFLILGGKQVRIKFKVISVANEWGVA